MIPFFKWSYSRVKCSLFGHELSKAEFYHGMSKSLQTGYICDRCGSTQLLAYRWQTVEEKEETGK